MFIRQPETPERQEWVRGVEDRNPENTEAALKPRKPPSRVMAAGDTSELPPDRILGEKFSQSKREIGAGGMVPLPGGRQASRPLVAIR